jgi:outer membrane protein assembly factor BamB
MTSTLSRRLLVGGLLFAAGGLGLAFTLTAADAPKAAATGDPDTTPDRPNDHPMFGGNLHRNMVDLNAKFGAVQLMPVKDGDKVTKEADAVVKWQAALGSRAYGGPVISGGKVFVGTNNDVPRNPRDQMKTPDGEVQPIDKGILMCFDEANGKLLWQHVNDKLPSGLVNDWPHEGVCSTPLVQGNRLYYVSNQCKLVCLDTAGLTDGNQGIQTEKYKTPTDADVIWELDLIHSLGVFPHNMSAGSPLLVGDILYIVTANGVNEDHVGIPAPDAPSFVAVDKKSGKVLWKRNDPGRSIMHGQWSNPVYGEPNGVRQVVFPGGDGWLHAYKPETGELLWKFDANPKDSVYELGGAGTRSDFIATPVFHDGRIYIGLGQDPEHFTGVSHFWCIDPSKATKPGMDISPQLAEKGADGKLVTKPNPNSGAVWQYGGAEKRQFAQRDFVFGRTMSTASVVDDVVYIAELAGFIHCLDAKTGKRYWLYDLKSAIWGSTSYVDGKVYLATARGDLYVFKHEKTPKAIDPLNIPDATSARDYRKKVKEKMKDVAKEYVLGVSEFDTAIKSTPVVANGVMYVMTEKTLYAITPKKK